MRIDTLFSDFARIIPQEQNTQPNSSWALAPRDNLQVSFLGNPFHILNRGNFKILLLSNVLYYSLPRGSNFMEIEVHEKEPSITAYFYKQETNVDGLFVFRARALSFL